MHTQAAPLSRSQRIGAAAAQGADTRVSSGIWGMDAEKVAGHGDCVLVAKGECVRFHAAYRFAHHLQASRG